MEIEKFWLLCLEHCKKELTAQQYNTWLKPLSAELNNDNNTVHIIAPNQFVLQWVKERFNDSLVMLATKHYDSYQLHYRVSKQKTLPKPTGLTKIELQKIEKIRDDSEQDDCWVGAHWCRIDFVDKIAIINELRGQAWFSIGNSKLALEYLNKSLEYYQDHGLKYSVAEVLNKIGEVKQNNNNIDEAINMYKNALAINKEINNAFGIVLNHINLASCYNQKGALQSMNNELSAGMDYVTKIGVDYLLLRYYKLYIRYSEKTGQHNAAHEFFDQYLPLSTQYLETTKQNLTSLMVELSENEIKEKNKAHQNELEFNTLQKERDTLRIRQLILIVSLILLLLFLIAYFLLNRIRMTRKLEHQVEERTKALRENEKILIETIQTRDKFYSIIAHDLKSPFNSLIGFSNLLNDEYNDFSDQERRQFITIIRNSSEEIFALLENLLDWSRKNSDKIKFKPIRVNLQQIVRQTVQLQEKNAQQKKINIENQIPKNTFVYADENMLRTIIRNLTSNALKFSNEGGKVTFATTTNEGFVNCTVTDNGIGMSEKTKENLFNIESKIKKKGTANETGTGLGLLLCKDFIERNGGNLTVESNEGEGAAFIFSLPAK